MQCQRHSGPGAHGGVDEPTDTTSISSTVTVGEQWQVTSSEGIALAHGPSAREVWGQKGTSEGGRRWRFHRPRRLPSSTTPGAGSVRVGRAVHERSREIRVGVRSHGPWSLRNRRRDQEERSSGGAVRCCLHNTDFSNVFLCRVNKPLIGRRNSQPCSTLDGALFTVTAGTVAVKIAAIGNGGEAPFPGASRSSSMASDVAKVCRRSRPYTSSRRPWPLPGSAFSSRRSRSGSCRPVPGGTPR